MIYFYIFIICITTYLIRMIPLTVFRKKITNVYLRSFLYYVPYSCLAIMTIPAIFKATGNYVTGAIGFAVALVVSLKCKNLVIVAFSSALSVYIAQLFIS